MSKLASNIKGTWRAFIGAFIIAFALVGALATSPAVSAQSEYSCGTYGAGSYGQACEDEVTPVTPGGDDDSAGNPGNSGGTGSGGRVIGGETPAGTTDPETPAVIDDGRETLLNNFSAFRTATGKAIDMGVGQTVYFVVDGERYGVTVKAITDDAVVLTITGATDDITIDRGERIEYDADGDGVADIAIAYTQRNGDKATLNFWQLQAPDSDETPAPADASSTDSWWWIWLVILGAAALLILWAIIAGIRRRNRNNSPPSFGVR